MPPVPSCHRGGEGWSFTHDMGFTRTFLFDIVLLMSGWLDLNQHRPVSKTGGFTLPHILMIKYFFTQLFYIVIFQNFIWFSMILAKKKPDQCSLTGLMYKILIQLHFQVNPGHSLPVSRLNAGRRFSIGFMVIPRCIWLYFISQKKPELSFGLLLYCWCNQCFSSFPNNPIPLAGLPSSLPGRSSDKYILWSFIVFG